MRKLKTWTDEQGGIYSADKKRLLKCPDVERYRIAEGCEETDEHAFDECEMTRNWPKRMSRGLFMPMRDDG